MVSLLTMSNLVTAAMAAHPQSDAARCILVVDRWGDNPRPRRVDADDGSYFILTREEWAGLVNSADISSVQYNRADRGMYNPAPASFSGVPVRFVSEDAAQEIIDSTATKLWSPKAGERGVVGGEDNE